MECEFATALKEKMERKSNNIPHISVHMEEVEQESGMWKTTNSKKWAQ